MLNDDLEIKSYVDEWLTYVPVTGKFFWKKDGPTGTRKAGRECGNSNSHGYKLIKLKGRGYKAHRIAFLIMTGSFPNIVDHIDRNRSNNVWSNLRNVNAQENCLNRSIDRRNKTGLTGVYYYAKEDVFTVTYGKQYLGRNKSLFEAACLRKSKEYEEKQ